MKFVSGAGATNIDLLYQGFDRLADIGEELYCKDFCIQLGGGVPATLINLGRLGINARIATELGDDMFSSFAEAEFKKNNVSPVNLYSGGGIPVNITSAIILPEDRTFYSYGNGALNPDDESEQKFYDLATGSKVTIMQPNGFLEVYKRLHKEGTILVLDTGWDDDLSIEKYREYLEIADYYTPNQIEAKKITGKGNIFDACKCLNEYFDKVIIKLDKDGCYGYYNGKEVLVKNIEEFSAVDSTGAGDAFLAGFVYGLFYDKTFEECILLGNITGGKSVTGVGALNAYLTENELLEYLEKYRRYI